MKLVLVPESIGIVYYFNSWIRYSGAEPAPPPHHHLGTLGSAFQVNRNGGLLQSVCAFPGGRVHALEVCSGVGNGVKSCRRHGLEEAWLLGCPAVAAL